MTYLICLYAASGQFIGEETIQFETDQTAMAHANQFLWPWGYEIWDDARLVTQSWPADVLVPILPAKAA